MCLYCRGNTVSNNAAKSTSFFTCFEGAAQLLPSVWAMQPCYNLATVINKATLEYQVGGATKLAELRRRLKRQLDPNNLFQRHGLVGL